LHLPLLLTLLYIDNDGRLSFAEWQQSFEECFASLKRVQAIARLDTAVQTSQTRQTSRQGGGCQDEAKRVKQNMARGESIAVVSDHFFTALDLDASGGVTRGELSAGLRNLGVPQYELDDEELSTLLEAFDKDHDGHIDVREWRDGIRGYKSREAEAEAEALQIDAASKAVTKVGVEHALTAAEEEARSKQSSWEQSCDELSNMTKTASTPKQQTKTAASPKQQTKTVASPKQPEAGASLKPQAAASPEAARADITRDTSPAALKPTASPQKDRFANAMERAKAVLALKNKKKTR
jgi:Ca2+-binding EF-hand superfamily protein